MSSIVRISTGKEKIMKEKYWLELYEIFSKDEDLQVNHHDLYETIELIKEHNEKSKELEELNKKLTELNK